MTTSNPLDGLEIERLQREIDRLRGLLREVRRAIPTGMLRITTADDEWLPERIDAALAGTASQPPAVQCEHEYQPIDASGQKACVWCNARATDNQGSVK